MIRPMGYQGLHITCILLSWVDPIISNSFHDCLCNLECPLMVQIVFKTMTEICFVEINVKTKLALHIVLRSIEKSKSI